MAPDASWSGSGTELAVTQPMDHSADGRLVDLALGRRRGGATGLVARYQPRVVSRLARLVGDRDLASDLAQDVFLQAFKDLASLREPERFGAWLKTIVQRTYRGWLRALGSRVERHATPIEPEQLDDVAAVVTSPLANDQPDVWRAVDRLPDPYRLTLIQRFREDLPVAEIAARQRIGLALAKFRLRRGLALVRRLLAPAR